MDAKIKYDRNVNFIGSNGYFKASGLDIYANESIVILQPITSKGEIGICSIEIPIEAIAALMNILNQAADVDD
jgi:hypothetical protein